MYPIQWAFPLIPMPRKPIIYTVTYEKDPEKARQARECVMTYIWHIAMQEGWFEGIASIPFKHV